MENKKGAFQKRNLKASSPTETPNDEAISKHTHQHNNAPQHLRFLQYGLKIPNHQHSQITSPYAHQQLNSPLHIHLHQHNAHYQTMHHHLQPSPQFNNMNIQQNIQFPSQNLKYVHQHQNPNNLHEKDKLLQNTQLPPSLAHGHNQISQNSPQIWVPHQPPLIHYHQHQTQMTEVQKPHTQITVHAHNKLKEPSEKKKSGGSCSQLRSPSAKRPLEAPVTMQGWLHKQGSEGLMLWKKRWFVLSEYCLFYYKGLEEGKLLGSILLPSYRVSICQPEDKVNRKYAFKCEHTNMRTYILAADSQELMLQWVRLLNLACVLQTNTENDTSETKEIPSTNKSSENPNVQKQHLSSTPLHNRSSSSMTDLSNPSQTEGNQFQQPLYANAPPKPRRLNDGFSSPSPDVLNRYPNPHNMESPCGNRSLAKSPISVYGQQMAKTVQHEYYCHNHLKVSCRECVLTPTGELHNNIQNTERRTPDTYGRSKSLATKFQESTDYEDVYNNQSMYKRPLSPIAYAHVVKNNPPLNPAYRTYTPVNMLGPMDVVQYNPSQMRKSPNCITRPHSADFLEYEINHRQPNRVVSGQQPRPKSSLDINRNFNDNDNYFYSEERYAEKMRKSAQYLHKIPSRLGNSIELITQKPAVIMQYLTNDTTFPLMRACTKPNNFTTSLHIREPSSDLQPVRSRSVLSEGSLSKDINTDFCGSSRNITETGSISPGYLVRDLYNYNINNINNREYDQFTRSASARLAQTTPQNERVRGERFITREGERKREESMRRLLEWKQRMLQSPLNRKIQGNRPYPGRYERCQINLENNYPVRSHLKHCEPVLDDRHSPTVLPQYNSYSSDDEEKEERSKESVHSQAGRTLDTFPSKSESPSPACTTSTIAFSTFKRPDKPSLMHSDVMHEAQYTNIFHLPKDKCKRDSEETAFTRPLKQFHKESSNLAHVSSLKSEYLDMFKQSPIITEIKSNGALVKSILAEFEIKIDTPEDNINQEKPISEVDIDSVIEENYMTMTPKKSVLGPRSSTNNNAAVIFDDVETDENHYVEMTQTAEATIFRPTLANSQFNQQQQPYEMVCAKKGKLEPVYMELKTPNDKLTIKDSPDLPDILMASKNKKTGINKSDSSDADDEASKDLDSLDTPSQPRFSLSDTFRPASYYLGASQTIPEFQDSSDSELVSPPPIPSSPPPMDELDNVDNREDFRFNNDISKKGQSYQYNLLPRLQVNRNSDQFFNSTNLKAINAFGKGSTQSLDIKKDIFSPCTHISDHSSVCTTNTDTENKFSSRLSQNSDCNVEIQIRMIDHEKMLKRRPVSEVFCNELESLDDVSTNCYLNDIQISNTSLANNDESSPHVESHDYENFFISSSYPKSKSVISAAKTPCSAIGYPRNAESTTIKEETDEQSSDEFILMGPSDSSESTSAEIITLLCNSNCSTPIGDKGIMSDQRNKSDNSLCQSAAPYYYSDLSISATKMETDSVLTLNNQRGALNGSKRDITHIINPIKCNGHVRSTSNIIESDVEKDTFKIAAEARSVSMDFLNLTDKIGSIDKKNLYESDTLKRQKISEATALETTNLYHIRKKDKFNTEIATTIHRSQSLEGLLENVLSENIVLTENEQEHDECNQTTSEGSYLWEEDSIWRERLRSASQRHTKSMEDLDSIGYVKKQKKSARGINRIATYVNDNYFKQDNYQKEQQNKDIKNGKNEIKKEGSFIIDREKLRQWDLLSSAPSDDQLSTVMAAQVQEGNNLAVELGGGNCDPSENVSAQEAASGSISMNTREISQLNTRDTFPRAISTKKIWSSNQPLVETRSFVNLTRTQKMEQGKFGTSKLQPFYREQHELPCEASHQVNTRKENWSMNDKMNMSAGELLGRTHEELVLLLIQLRRQNAQAVQAIENCYNEIDTIQAQLHVMDQTKRMENLQKLEQIKQHLLELEKQYEKGKPLVNLVDNMVKLGSLYRTPSDRPNLTPYIRDRLEFNQQVQERRLLAEEKREWDRLNPNNFHLQEKVQQLYQLDRLIHEESGTLQSLQQDKEDIERALGGLRHRLTKGFNDPAEIEQARKQEIILENELSRVHLMLAQNSKKLEETVAGNARLEQELLVLRQKLQTSKQQRGSQQFSNAGDSLTCAVGNSAMLESDLQRVQKKIGDLQKQRQELSIQVRQLTDRSNNVLQQKLSPGSIQNSQCKKKIISLWRETDLDTMNIIDHGELWDNSASTNTSMPLFINTDMKLADDFYNRSTRSSDSTSDNASLNSNIPHEKQEIKTVRIVKRESERRQRDREKTTAGKWDTVMEEDDSSQNSSILFRPTAVQKIQTAIGLASPSYEDNKGDLLNRENSISSPNLLRCSDNSTISGSCISTDKSPELSPIFKSEAARQIITEMSIHETPRQNNRRTFPKEKRRHYTAPHNNLIMKSLHQLPTDNNTLNKIILNSRRARDDMDMERALRQRIDAPDVVRSTLSSKELKYNETTIDNILGTPNKISIPERYIPEQLPQLSAEEQEYRLRKVESIKKMLSDTALASSSSTNLTLTENKEADGTIHNIANKATTKMIEEKKQREHLLHLNQILAKQVMEMSKIVAVKALAKLPLQFHQVNTEEEDSSPLTPLPIYQQRDNFYS